MACMTRDDAPSRSRIFTRPSSAGVTFYVEVADVGVMVIRTESNPRDLQGKLYPQTGKLLSRAILDRLEQQGTPLMAPLEDPDQRPDLDP